MANELPANFFSGPLADEALEELAHNLERVREGPWHDTLIEYFLANAEPTCGLIVAGRLGDKWPYYWHQRGYVQEFEAAAEYPKVYRRRKEAEKRVADLNSPDHPRTITLPQGVVFELVYWTESEVTSNPTLERYAGLRRRFPGSPRQ